MCIRDRNGTSTEGEKVRPHWEDGTSAYTIKKFGVVNRYDLSKEFPAITPVSYTHLDVYKRQGVNRGLRDVNGKGVLTFSFIPEKLSDAFAIMESLSLIHI